LRKWNARINLVSNAEPQVVIQTHFADSLSCVRSPVITPNTRLLDIGTGAGFPGIPLKIYLPSLHATVVDAVSKKIAFLKHLCRALGLQEVTCIASRVEHLSSVSASHNIEDSFDVIVSRAVGSLPYLLSLVTPLLKADGSLLFQRGPQAMQELATHADDLRTAGFQVQVCQEIQYSWLDRPRYLVAFRRMDRNCHA
jgi:16S rRNA (guanine527-N7)-methyltransferase